MAAVATPARLSVCIPTHHGRCALLEEALESIAAQATPDLALEVVVSDNASRDGTEAMIEHFRARHPQLALVYARNERDVRLQNIMRVVERATGDWCWLFGSDDVMTEDGLRVVADAIARYPDAAGIGFGKVNFSHDMDLRLAPDAPAFFPTATDTTVYTGFERVVGELAFQHAYLGTNVVRRPRWLAAAERAGSDVAHRHPDWPQLVIIAEMVRRDPAWVWLPDVLVRARAGRPYLVEQDGAEPNLARMHATLVDGLRNVWAEIAGRGTPLHRALLGKSYGVAASDDVVRNIKLQRGQTLGRDLTILRSFTRAFWRLPEFRRRCLPLLLVPAVAGRAAGRAGRRRRPMTPLSPQEIATHVRATLPGVLRPRESAPVTCVVANHGSRELRPRAPHPVALGFRWFERPTGRLVLDGGRARLPCPLRSGESVTVEGRVNAPWVPGDYELRISPVQELVAWFDDIDPANGVRFHVRLEPPPA